MRHLELRKHRNGQNNTKPSEDSTSLTEYCQTKITKLIIQKHNYSDEVEIELQDGYELRQKEDGTWVATRIKSKLDPNDLKEGVEILYTINLEAVDSSCFDFELTGKIIALQEGVGEKYYITSLGHIITEDKIIEIL